jgi:hypothetical protein
MQTHHAAGPAPDTVPLTIEFTPPGMRFSPDKIYYTTERELPAGVFFSIDEWVNAIRVRNKTALSVGRYDIVAYYNPIEITGVDPALIMRH